MRERESKRPVARPGKNPARMALVGNAGHFVMGVARREVVAAAAAGIDNVVDD